MTCVRTVRPQQQQALSLVQGKEAEVRERLVTLVIYGSVTTTARVNA